MMSELANSAPATDEEANEAGSESNLTHFSLILLRLEFYDELSIVRSKVEFVSHIIERINVIFYFFAQVLKLANTLE
jgi:hypothetical protein